MRLTTRLIAAGVGLFVVTLATVPASAQDPAAIVAKRVDTMKAQQKSVDAIKAYTEDKGDLAAAQAAGAQLVQSLPTVPSLFPQNTGIAELPDKSRAKPEIWTQWDKFNDALKVSISRAEALNTALRGGDKAAITAALDNMARDWGGRTPNPGGCGVCHGPFRQPQQRS
jgi:cytochrome c556